MKVALCCDHAGYELKEIIKGYLESQNIEYKDFGCYSTESVDYPDFAHLGAQSVESGECTCGIAVCGSGNGIQMTLNKHQGIRAALCWIPEIAQLAKAHNNANFCALPGRFVTGEEGINIVKAYLETTFEGGRHQRRIDKIPVC